MATATLTTLTPVHIGSGQTLKKGFDFIQEGNKIGFLDLDKIVHLIGEGSIPQLSATIEKGEPLGKFLREGRGIKDFRLEDVSHRVAEAKKISSTATELKEQYFTSMKGACIPGSSIKGALKTAIWESLTTESFLNTLQRSDLGFTPKWKDSTVEEKLFGNDANKKSTRFLKIGDCHFENQNTQVHEIGIFNADYDKWRFKEGKSFIAEVIPADYSSRFELKMDASWLEKNKIKYPQKWEHTSTVFISGGLSAFCRLINNYTKQQIDWEQKDLEPEGFNDVPEGEIMLQHLEIINNEIEAILKKQTNEFICRIGGNSGWNFTTGAWMKKEFLNLNQEDYNGLRKAIQKKDYSDMALWPKTRKMTTSGIPLGFVKITFNSEKND